MSIAVELNTVFDYAEKINLYNNGELKGYLKSEPVYNEILGNWKSLIDGAHEMPAYGVSLNRETTKAMLNGIWVEFVFGSIYECNGMPFTKLLVNIVKDSYGFNIIRYNSKAGYDGRCFYYDLVGKTTSDFYYNLLKLCC